MRSALSHIGRISGNIGASAVVALAILAGNAHAQIAADGLMPRAPLLITPMVSGILLCNEGNQRTELTTLEQIEEWCEKNHQTRDLAAKAALDELEPNGPAGKVQLGYTLLVPLLELYEKQGNDWRISPARAKKYLNVISVIDRPVVVYLMGDHYDSSSALSQELARDPQNLLAYASGPVPVTRYIGHGIIPFTLRTDENIPVNRYRFQALRYMTQQLRALDAPTRSRIAAVTLAGEIHHMYPDFENGVGEFDHIKVTDYRPESQQEFRAWLKDKYGTVERLNRKLGFRYAAMADIEAPSLDIRTQPLKTFAQHYDAYAAGTLPMSGWLWDPEKKIDQITLHVDGKFHAAVAVGLGRMDVYRAKPEVTTPNTGFRGLIDFSAMAPGKHVAQMVASSKGKRFLLGEREFVVVPPDQSSTSAIPQPQRLKGLPEAGELASVQLWLDRPKPLQDVYYNPMAREWNRFRAHQVNQLLDHFYRIARAEGLPADLLYSHQIIPETNGAWNPVLFASDQSISNTTPWRTGINQYGASPYVFEYLNERLVRAYGVPEFNPLQGRNPEAARAALVRHYQAGARFVSPFFISVVPARLRAADDKRLFDIATDNPVDGNDAFHDTLQWFVRK
ncbi:beta-galactosidase [Diaphorobacter aerolatus]|uniref:Beta-galactosidase n=1 Tax=Diaphorobacter aerolatus TaxID=1288495 RepID=A0A7H0GNV3_9BURK|nr:beta-galactosidase [Diaphorobacter aerolatus]QNP49969.1 beta-galactosidase [Diaphorobacter aerolatus]